MVGHAVHLKLKYKPFVLCKDSSYSTWFSRDIMPINLLNIYRITVMYGNFYRKFHHSFAITRQEESRV